MAKSLKDFTETNKSNSDEVTDFKLIYENRNDNLKYLFNLTELDRRRFRIGKIMDKDVYVRVLTVNETKLLPSLLEESLRDRLSQGLDVSDSTRVMEEAVIRIMIASCPEPLPVKCNLKYVNDCASFKFSDLGDLALSELENLLTSQKEVEAMLNPKLDEIPVENLNMFIEGIKKKELLSKDLNWHTLYQILDHVLLPTESEE